MSIAAAFPLDVQDACGNFFGTALRACDPPIAPDSACLEIGCAEFNWLAYAVEAWPAMRITGIDWRLPKYAPVDRATVIRADVMQPDLFPRESFDWALGISSIEHIGLGHYDSDPEHVDGDAITMINIWHWLKPGGWIYFDVPWCPGLNKYSVCGTKHRVYDSAALRSRLGVGHLFDVRWWGIEPFLDFYLWGAWMQKRTQDAA